MANFTQSFAGNLDVELSDLGKKQAELAAEYITKNFSVDKIYSSNLKRAYDTAVPTAKKLGLDINATSDFIEIYGKEFQLT
jgi:broad specificity phosphatase PhoE